MMKLLKYTTTLLLLVLITSCEKDNDQPQPDPPRDASEVYQENIEQIETFLKTHFYTVKPYTDNPNLKHIVIDTIAGANANKTPIFEEAALKSKTIESAGDVNYKLYYLQVRKGAQNAYQPTFADKVSITFQLITMKGEVFDKAIFPQVINIPESRAIAITKGTIKSITEFKGASGFVENADGTIAYNDDYGIGAVFVPSGLGYFQSSPLGTPLESYQPFIMTFELYLAAQTDQDEDGIPSYMEDPNENNFIRDDDTDRDGVLNYKDPDDDGDGVLTKDEIIVHETSNGIITPDDIEFPDSDGDGIADYLDPDTY